MALELDFLYFIDYIYRKINTEKKHEPIYMYKTNSKFKAKIFRARTFAWTRFKENYNSSDNFMCSNIEMSLLLSQF